MELTTAHTQLGMSSIIIVGYSKRSPIQAGPLVQSRSCQKHYLTKNLTLWAHNSLLNSWLNRALQTQTGPLDQKQETCSENVRLGELLDHELLPELLLVGRTASSVMISPDCTTTLVRAHSSACLVISRVASIATTTLSEKSRPTPILRPLLKFDLWWLLLLCWGLLHVDDTTASSRLPLEHALLRRLLIASGVNEHFEYSTMRRTTNCCWCLLRAPGRRRKVQTHPEYTGTAPPFLKQLLPRGSPS